MARRKWTFRLAYEEVRHQIEAYAVTMPVPGYTADELKAEMLLCLLRATATYSPKHRTSFSTYWNFIWRNRRLNLIRNAKVAYRHSAPVDWQELEAMEMPPQAVLSKLSIDDVYFAILPPPPGLDEDERIVWAMLAQGYERQDILANAQISRRRYYAILSKFNDEHVKRYILG